MGEQRITTSLKLGGWKKRKKITPEKIYKDVLWMFISCLLIIMITSVSGSGWEIGEDEDADGDNSVNVISVENMDALLRLRMVTELNSLEAFVNMTKAERRSRRWVLTTNRQKFPPPSKSQVAPLCLKKECSCVNVDAFLNVSCSFQSNEVVDLGPGSLPPKLIELHIANAKELKILPGAFSEHPHLLSASFRKTANLSIRNQAFHNLSKSHFVLEIKDCQTLILEEHSFRNLRSPLSAVIENCNRVIMKKSIFSWLLDLEVKNVPNLEVVQNTFSVEIIKDPELTAITITFQNVTVNKVPNATFPLSAAKIRFIDCAIDTISGDAFNAIILASVSFEGTKIRRLESKAFSDRTLINKLEFSRVNIDNIASNVLNAANNLTIEDSRIGEITGGAFKVNTACMTLSRNIFRRIRHQAFEIHEWNSIIIEGNRFEKLEPESFLAPFSHNTKIKNEFIFSDNILLGTEVDTLSFIPNEPGLDVRVAGNKFEEPCHCHLERWLAQRSPSKGNALYETSFCLVSDLLARCYNLEKGYMLMKNYTNNICGSASQVICEESIRSYRPDILTELDLENTERTVLGVIFLGVICSVGIMLLVLSGMWMKQKGACGRMGRYLTPSKLSFSNLCSRLFNTSNLVTTSSISRINIHEYAEIQNQINQQQKHTILPIEENSDEEELVIYEDKATQTLPEELTQELLQSLREKLDDPENYNEARDMIEHLYDLIKVEESCNKNDASPRTSFLFEEEDEEEGGNIYDVIQPRKVTRKNSKPKRKNPGVAVNTVGTRAPSPDKLLPINYNIPRPVPTIVNEYCQPRDRKSNEYCELPGTDVMPDVITDPSGKPFNCLRSIADRIPKSHVYAEPLTSTMINRPLPNKPDQPGTSYA